jgi:hypothetical protein
LQYIHFFIGLVPHPEIAHAVFYFKGAEQPADWFAHHGKTGFAIGKLQDMGPLPLYEALQAERQSQSFCRRSEIAHGSSCPGAEIDGIKFSSSTR